MRIFLLMAVAFAAAGLSADDLTIGSKVYYDYRIVTVGRTYVRIAHKHGGASISRDDWPADKADELEKSTTGWAKKTPVKPIAKAPEKPETEAPAVFQPPTDRKGRVNYRYNFFPETPEFTVEGEETFFGVQFGTHIAEVPEAQLQRSNYLRCGIEGCDFLWIPATGRLTEFDSKRHWDYRLSTQGTGQVSSISLQLQGFQKSDFPAVIAFVKEMEERFGRKFAIDRSMTSSSFGILGKDGKVQMVKVEYIPFGEDSLEGLARDWEQYEKGLRILDLRLQTAKSEITLRFRPEREGRFAARIYISSLRARNFYNKLWQGKLKPPLSAWAERVPSPASTLPPEMVERLRAVQLPHVTMVMPFPSILDKMSEISRKNDASDSAIPFRLDMPAEVAREKGKLEITVGKGYSLLDVLDLVCRAAELTARAEGSVIVLTPLK